MRSLDALSTIAPLLSGAMEAAAITTRHSFALRVGDRFFYGWVMLGVASLVMFASGPGQSHTFSVFLLPISEDLGISRTSVSGAYAFATLVAAFGLPHIGRLVDRHGVRVVLTGVGVAFGTAAVAFGAVSGFVLLTLGFAALRFLGQGSLMLCAGNLTSQWFDRRRGLALSLTMLGFSASVAVHPPLAQWLTDALGWRTAWVIMGVTTWLLLLPPVLLLVFDRPEALGLRPDGPVTDAAARPTMRPDRDARPETPPDGDVPGLTLPEARRTGAFWTILASNCSFSALVTAMFFHQVSVFGAQGLDAATAASMFSVSAVTMVIMTPLVGMLLDRFPTRPLYTAALISVSVSLVAMSFVSDLSSAVVFGVLFGVANAAMHAHFTFVWPRFFGRRHLGSIQGVAQMGAVIGASVGPIPLGLGYDHFGGYGGTLVALAAIPLMCAVAVAFMRAPRLEKAEV
ncbi:MAG: MFS transporter [Thiotrichales bacterium]|nr:MFS transporter [Thiotrichales bacterium]